MKPALLIVCVFLVALTGAKTLRRKYDGHKIFTLNARNEEQAKALQKLEDVVDFWTDLSINRPIDVHVSPELVDDFLRYLTLHGIPTIEVVPDLQKLVEHERELIDNNRRKRSLSGRADIDYTPNYDDLETWMTSIASTYDFASVYNFGSTYEGRQVKLIKLSAGNARNKNIVFLDAGIHSREWMTTATMVWMIDELTSKYGKDQTITDLLNKYDFYLLPVYNPDGYQYSQDSERFWRKNRSPNDKASCPGTDLNRNFDYPVFGGPSTSSNPCSDTYKGKSGISELENQNLRDFMLANSEDVVMYINIHAYSQLWFTPWGYTTDRPADAKDLDAVANAGADALFKVHGTKFEVGPPGLILYESAGGADDWTKGGAGVKYSFGMELRPEGGSGFRGFLVDPEVIQPSGEELLAGIQAAIKEIEVQQARDRKLF